MRALVARNTLTREAHAEHSRFGTYLLGQIEQRRLALHPLCPARRVAVAQVEVGLPMVPRGEEGRENGRRRILGSVE